MSSFERLPQHRCHSTNDLPSPSSTFLDQPSLTTISGQEAPCTPSSQGLQSVGILRTRGSFEPPLTLPLCPPTRRIAGIHNVEGVAVDWMGDNLYWTDDGPKKTISVARLEKAAQTRKTLIEGKMTHPRAIVVDPLNG